MTTYIQPTDFTNAEKCRCCGKFVPGWYAHNQNGVMVNIHTQCIGKHWSKHSNKLNASRCVEFSN